MDDDVLEQERQGWKALSTSGEAAAAFYDEVLADDVLFLLPGGMVMDDCAAVIAAMGGEPWSSYELSDERVVPVGDDCRIVAYRACAERDGTTYEALFNSTYARSAQGWRLVLHQQTPV